MVRECSKASLRGGLSRNAGQNHAWKPKIWMVKDIEESGFHLELRPLGHGKPFREIEVIPEEVGTAQGIPTEVSELAILWVVATGALPCTWINR